MKPKNSQHAPYVLLLKNYSTNTDYNTFAIFILKDLNTVSLIHLLILTHIKEKFKKNQIILFLYIKHTNFA